MAAYERAFGDQWDPLQRASLERKIGEALFRRGEHEEARRHLCRALELLGVPFPTELSAVRPALLRAMFRQIGHRLLPAIFVRGGQAIEDGPAVREELEIYDALIWIEVVSSPERFMLASLRALNKAERANIVEWTAEGFTGLQVALDFLGLYFLGGYYGQLASKITQDSVHPKALALAFQSLCMHASWTGNGHRAIALGDQSAKHHRDTGNLRGWGAAVMLAGETQVYLGQIEPAQERANLLIRDGQDGNDLQVQAWGYSLAGPVAQITGNLTQAINHFRTYYEHAEAIGDTISMMEANTQLAHSHALQGDLEAAQAALTKSEQIINKYHVLGRRFLGRLYNVRAEVWLLAAQQNQGEARKEWLRKAGAACKAARRMNRAYLPWLAWSYRLQGRYEQLRGKPESARRWFARSLTQAEKLGQIYEARLTRQVMDH
jgi:tetratricopeptide (TPR) repeat protein